ncbi:MAG: hypothetical protein J0G94_15090 [Sphingomonadales bacterium]|nr:hypothetical protein [Sphingomonadales bacterium]
MRLPILASILPSAALLLAAPVQAHHGWTSYDAAKTLTIDAPLTSLRWANPHGAATVQHEGKSWDVVLAPVTRMEARGLSEAMLRPGKKVTLVGYPRSDGTNEMRIERVIVEGKTYELR